MALLFEKITESDKFNAASIFEHVPEEYRSSLITYAACIKCRYGKFKGIFNIIAFYMAEPKYVSSEKDFRHVIQYMNYWLNNSIVQKYNPLVISSSDTFLSGFFCLLAMENIDSFTYLTERRDTSKRDEIGDLQACSCISMIDLTISGKHSIDIPRCGDYVVGFIIDDISCLKSVEINYPEANFNVDLNNYITVEEITESYVSLDEKIFTRKENLIRKTSKMHVMKNFGKSVIPMLTSPPPVSITIITKEDRHFNLSSIKIVNAFISSENRNELVTHDDQILEDLYRRV